MRACMDCKFWEETRGGWGECRRSVPTANPLDSNAVFPCTDEMGWCGEWEAGIVGVEKAINGFTNGKKVRHSLWDDWGGWGYDSKRGLIVDSEPPHDPINSTYIMEMAAEKEGAWIIGDDFKMNRMPDKTPDELWSELKDTLKKIDPMLASMIAHGRIISISPDSAEIGFSKSLYCEEFEGRMKERDVIGNAVRGVLGVRDVRVLLLDELKNEAV